MQTSSIINTIQTHSHFCRIQNAMFSPSKSHSTIDMSLNASIRNQLSTIQIMCAHCAAIALSAGGSSECVYVFFITTNTRH